MAQEMARGGAIRRFQISRIEVLGYHRLTDVERCDLGEFLAASPIVPLSEGIANKAIVLRQLRNIGLADALIAATALEADWELVSRNVEDFRWIANLRLINPFDTLPFRK